MLIPDQLTDLDWVLSSLNWQDTRQDLNEYLLGCEKRMSLSML